MATTHISVEDAAADFPGLIAKVRAGNEVCIDEDVKTIAVMRSPERPEEPKLLSEMLAGLTAEPSMRRPDESFAADVENAMRVHAHERLIDPWESF
jgi:antitoxin (DNA-binding transcriptional repressor) of toxin-antitoxin stability system